MMPISRRGFINTAAGFLVAARSGAAAVARIEVLTAEPVATISPDIYGHFTEHIGGVVYDGIWVGQKSKIPNQGGIRTALVDRMRRLKAPVIRWPGGCFADSYNWRDGIGPREKRPIRANFWINHPFLRRAPDGKQKYEPNEFGTNEFAHFCRLCGSQPYFAVNVRSLTPHDFQEWVEYANAPAGSTTLASLRGGEPLNVRYWGVGNESWGCGGNFTPEEYAVEYRRFSTWVPQFGVRPAYIAAGPNGADLHWTRGFFSKLLEKGRGMLASLYGFALHYYCGTAGKGHAIDFTTDDWYELLAKACRMEQLITRHWSVMGEYDREHRVKLVVDEWGAWHRAGSEVHPAYLFCQTPTLRDALVSALTLDIFNRHADKVVMANVAQLVNNLHCLFLAREDQFITTPNYDVFEMYSAHAGAKAVRTVFSAPRARGLQALAGSASVRGKQLVLTVVNSDTAQPYEAEIAVRGAAARSYSVRTLSAPDIHAHNSFANPRGLETKDSHAAGPVYRFPPASVTRLIAQLA